MKFPHPWLSRGAALVLAFLAGGALPAVAADEPPPLPAFNANIHDSSISGISSGAFMAVQFATAWSSTIKGVGVIAGGPYFCAYGIPTSVLTGASIFEALFPCMKANPPPKLPPLIEKATEFAANGDIDTLSHLRNQKVYLFSGYNDSVVNTRSVDVGDAFYRHFLKNEPHSLFYQNAIGAGHSQVTVDYKLDCQDNKDDYINKCGYDQAGIILQFISGRLNPPNTGAPTGKIITFSQRAFTRPASPASYSLGETGYAYVPQTCAAGEHCTVHIALHGCKQYAGLIGTDFVEHAGYNPWADTNHLIILYPQTNKSQAAPFNPEGCWDWWGYTNFQYTTKKGRQIATLHKILTQATSAVKPAPAPAAQPFAAQAIDQSDTSVALAWTAVPGATGYSVTRSPGAGAPVTVKGLSYGDAGLTPETAYTYTVAAVGKGGNSATVTVSTRPVPPRCPNPGTCALGK